NSPSPGEEIPAPAARPFPRPETARLQSRKKCRPRLQQETAETLDRIPRGQFASRHPFLKFPPPPASAHPRATAPAPRPRVCDSARPRPLDSPLPGSPRSQFDDVRPARCFADLLGQDLALDLQRSGSRKIP